MAAYTGNLGMMEMFQFVQVATDEEQKQMDDLVKKEDWEAYKILVKRVIRVELK